MMRLSLGRSKYFSVAGPLRKRFFARVQRRAAFFLASIGVSVLAALEQAERMREKYIYVEIVSRKKRAYAEDEFLA